jgi:hypothetical protein
MTGRLGKIVRVRHCVNVCVFVCEREKIETKGGRVKNKTMANRQLDRRIP